MRFENDGMSLWFGTADTPAPGESVAAGDEAGITIAVCPPDGGNKVELHYRVNGGSTKLVLAQWIRSDSASQAHYFKARFPSLTTGDVVDFTVICRCAGRQVPSPEEAKDFAASFRVVASQKIPESTWINQPRGQQPNYPSTRLSSPAEYSGRPVRGLAGTETNAHAALSFTVSGKIKQPNGPPFPGVTVRAFNKDLPSLGPRGETQLGTDAVTDADGFYKIFFTERDLQKASSNGRDKLRPDLFIRAFDGEIVLGQSVVNFNAPLQTSVDLTVAIPDLSEYEAVLHALGPSLNGASIAALTDEDIGFLLGQNGVGESRLEQQSAVLGLQINKDRLDLLRRVTQSAEQTATPAEALYGWAQTLGHNLTAADLAKRADDELGRALTDAVAKKIVPATLRDRIDTIVRGVKQVGFVSQQATAQLLDQGTSAALAGFRVRVLDPGAGTTPAPIGSFVTDGNGTFSFRYMSPSTGQVPGAARQFLLKMTTPKGDALPDSTIAVEPGQTGIIRVKTELPGAAPTAPTIDEVARASAGAIPAALVSLLHQQNINSLADIRRVGGVAAIADLPIVAPQGPGAPAVPSATAASSDAGRGPGTAPPGLELHTALSPGTPAAQVLRAHLELSPLSPDVQVNAALIQKGFLSVAAIADTPRSSFASAMHDTLGDFAAVQMHVAARARTAFLDNVLTGLAAEQASGFPADAALAQSAPFPASCRCDDCRSAISPALYLGDLLGYAVKNISITADGLAATFHQPFADLSISCSAVTKKVRQVRLVIEILRDYLGARPLSDIAREASLQQTEQQYRQAAYFMLLTRVGTSYEELRAARGATGDQRTALGDSLGRDRLGIDLSASRPDEFDRLFLDVSAPAGSPRALTERALEELFGLVDTTRDRLSDGAKFGDDVNPRITRWNLTGVEWGRNTDPDGYIYLNLVAPSPGTVSLDLFKDAARTPTHLVASSGPVDGTKPVVALPQNSSDLSGTFQLASPMPSNAIFLNAVPNLLSWRIRHVRAVWTEEDRPDDPYTATASPLLPAIDPDLIGPDDFRTPFPKANAADPDRAFDLWLVRRQFVDDSLANLRSTRATNGAAGLTVILKQVLGDPLPDLDGHFQTLTTGTQEQVKVVEVTIEQLGFSLDSFHRLMEIRVKDNEAQIDPRIQVADDEWGEVNSILTQLRKVKLFGQWRAEEQKNPDESQRIMLGPQEFWVSGREPTVGMWPVIPAAGVPLIDPDLVTLKDLPEAVAGQKAIDLWHARVTGLANIKQQLQTERLTNGFDAMVWRALGSPPGTPLSPQDDLQTLRQQLTSGNAAVAAAAQNAIANDLRLTVNAFTLLMVIRDKDAATSQAQKPTAAEYAEVYAILTNARKLKTEYPQWAAAELAAFPAEAPATQPLAYWRARKASLPRWRATAAARQSWQQALQSREAPPIIDPDLVYPDFDLRDPVPGNPAFDLWKQRSDDIASRVGRIITAAPSAAAFDSFAKEFLDVGADTLAALDDQRKNGFGIQTRLDQLGLSAAAFDALLGVKTLFDQTQQPLSTEWGDVASILVQAFKRRQAGLWRLQEQARGVVLSPDLFVVFDTGSDPATPSPALPKWRATPLARRAWQETLQSRIDEQQTAITGLAEACDATESILLEAIRDALILASDAAGSDLDHKATWLIKRFFVDTKMSGDQTTTRVEQAIETLQGLLLALSTGPFNPSGFQMDGGAAAVIESGRVHIFARGSDNALWHLSGDGESDWTDWESLGTIFSGDPAVCSSAPGRLDVFALRPDSRSPLHNDPHVWQRTFQNGAWSDWQPVGSAPGGWLGRVGAVSSVAGVIDLFISTGPYVEFSSVIKHAHFENNIWSPWEFVPDSFNMYAPATTSRGPQRLDLFALDASGNSVWHIEFDNGWKTWESLGGVANAAPSACAPSNTQLSVFVRGTDQALYQNSFVQGSPWSGWSSLGGGLTSGPSAVALSPIRLDVFVRYTDNNLWLRHIRPGGTWAPVISEPALTMSASNFSEDWKWLGSYATWRAAMLVFLYPENLLLPNLRSPERQTPKFQDLVRLLGEGDAVTPEAVCRRAKEYAAYFQDVCQLVVEATCQTLTVTYSSDACGSVGIPVAASYMFYMFGRGYYSDKLYYSTYDPSAAVKDKDYAQSFWVEIDVSQQGSVKFDNWDNWCGSVSDHFRQEIHLLIR
jgi:hypothetical protein